MLIYQWLFQADRGLPAMGPAEQERGRSKKQRLISREVDSAGVDPAPLRMRIPCVNQLHHESMRMYLNIIWHIIKPERIDLTVFDRTGAHALKLLVVCGLLRDTR